jgi:hypothetical protein
MELDGQMLEALEQLKESLKEIKQTLDRTPQEPSNESQETSYSKETLESSGNQSIYSTLSFPNPFIFL